MITLLLLVVGLLAIPSALDGQVTTVEPEVVEESPPAIGDVLGAARDAQAGFERVRLRHARLTIAGGSGNCDEHVGRFCTRYHEGDWYPQEEAEEIVEARSRLLNELDSLQLLAPSDEWILGQRVWYRGDGGEWSGAFAVAEGCGAPRLWWCESLEGFALHGLGRYDASLQVFESALSRMDVDVALRWRVPERAVDRTARGMLREARDASPDSLDAALSRLWTFADPLFLVDGNDRMTAHYARWTTSLIRENAKNPYGITWSSDLEELTVRHGWEIGWERTLAQLSGGRGGAIGHKHPEGRDYMPSGRALRDPAVAREDDLAADRREPRSLYAPPYSPLLLPIEPEVAVFRRGDRVLLVATPYLPDDTTFHSGHQHPRPWLEPGEQVGLADRIGLFAVPVAGGPLLGSTSVGSSEGTLVLEVPVGDYVVSVESWSPERRRAGRSRMGLHVDRAPEDIAHVSDILLLRRADPRPTTLEEALPLVLVHPKILEGEPLSIAWEVFGLGFRHETVEYQVSVERTGRNVFRRLGEFLRVTDRPQPVELSWQEPAPADPTPQFRHLDLDLPPLDPGRYQITLTLRTGARSDVVVTRTFQVTDP